MKRTLTIMIAVLLTMALCACSAATTQPLPEAQTAPAAAEAAAPAETPVPATVGDGGIRIIVTNKSDTAIPLLVTYNMAAFQMGQPSLTISAFELAPNASSTVDITAEEVATLEEQGYLTRAADGAAFFLKLGVAACETVTAEDRAADLAVATFMGELTVACNFGTDVLVEWDGVTFAQTNPAQLETVKGA